ncbi:hypothetical protein V7166_17535 [Bacillus thuringiensis]
MSYDVVIRRGEESEHKQFTDVDELTKYVTALASDATVVSITSTECVQMTREYTIAFDGKFFLQEKR